MTTTTRTDPPGPYKVGQVYLVTEVLGWWLQNFGERPEWFPVTGPLHEDKAFFDLHEHHYHVDPRFLNGRHEAAARLKGLQQGKLPQTWHRSAVEILARFPVPNDQHWHFVITNGLTRLAPNVETQLESRQNRDTWRRPHERKQLTRSEAWGRERIRTRRVERVCLRPLPEIRIDKPGAATPTKRPAPESTLDPFHQLRAFFTDAAGDTCPHRGYDLRTVPIEADGYRQCPLHQLRVRALAVRTPECAKHRP